MHATTNESPAKLLLGRQLRSRLDLIKPNTRDTVDKKHFESFTEPKRPQFSKGEKVMVRDYRENTNKWTDAKITEKSAFIQGYHWRSGNMASTYRSDGSNIG